MNGSVAYILMGFPRVSETFIASEIHRVEQAGVPLKLFVIKPVEAREQGHDHPVLDAIVARPEYLPDPVGLTKPLHLWRWRDVREFAPALKRCARRRPQGVARAARTALAQAFRDRRAPLSGPRKIYVKELIQAITLADRLLREPDVRHVHAHFAHGTTTITWLAACIAGLPFSFTGHARDIYAPELNPRGWLQRKLNAARFVVTCTEANVRHLQAIAPKARVHLVYHGLSADFTNLLREDRPRPATNGHLRVLGVGRLVAKKGFDTLVDACAVLQARGVPFEALIVGQDDKDGAQLRAHIERTGVPVALPGPVGPAALLDEYRRAGALCMPSRLLPNDRDGIPNVLVEAMAAGAPVVATNVSGIPELVDDEVNGLLVAPDDPQALADALVRLHEDTSLVQRLTENGRATVQARFDGERLAQDLAALFQGGDRAVIVIVGTARPRAVHCVTEHEHRDRALADEVASGRFTFAGETRTLGLEPDWLDADLPDDEEWRIDWVKFYYGLDLADAFRATGDERYLKTWERLVASFVVQVPPDHDDSEVTARRILNWIYAWQRLPEVDEFVAHALYESLGQQVRHVRATLSPERNHRTLELYALLVAALALPDFQPGLQDFAVEQLHENLLADFGPDGVHRERSTHYHCIALRSFVGARENCRRFGVTFPVGFDERLARACEFARDCRRPDGTIPALSDSDTGDYTELLRLAARLLARDDLLRSEAGDYPDGGYFVQRTRERYLIFDCGPLGDGGHGHYDALSLEAWAGDEPLVLDPGRYTYAEGDPNLRHWFRGTAAHNTVTVDGLDQTPYARSRSSLPSAKATFLGHEDDTLAGEVRSPCYDALHRRRVTLVDGHYWVIEDELEDERNHRYDLRWHLPPGPAHLLPDGVVTPNARITITGARSVALEDGWISPEYGVKHPAKVVSAVAVGRTARFVTRLEPRR